MNNDISSEGTTFFVRLVFTKLGSSLVSRCGAVNCVRVACVTAKSVCIWHIYFPISMDY